MAEDFDLNKFGLFNPDQPVSALNPWRQLGRNAMILEVAVAGKDEVNKLKIGKSPSDEINRLCDEWITAFLDSSDRSNLVAPVELRGWLTLRAVKACLVCKHNEQTGVPPPQFYKENFRKEMMELLIDAWYSERYDDEILRLCEPASTVKPKAQK